jgi:hypothetical protein
MIYNEVTAPAPDAWPALCCLSCRQHTKYYYEKFPDLLVKAIFPAILQTNRMVLREGLPVLYFSIASNILCNNCIAEHCMAAAPLGSLTDRLVVCERPVTGSYIKYATLNLFPWDESLDNFPNTWRKFEPKILADFDNLAIITLHLDMFCRVLGIKMVRQRYRPKAEYIHRVQDGLKSFISAQGLACCYHTNQMVRLCNLLLPSDCASAFDYTVSGVRSIHWVEWENAE